MMKKIILIAALALVAFDMSAKKKNEPKDKWKPEKVHRNRW